MKRIIFSTLAIAAIALTSCKKDEVDSTELGSATISGTVRADINQLNDVNTLGLYDEYSMPDAVEGMAVKVTVNTGDWVQAPEAGYTYDTKTYTTTTDASGNFTLTIPATDEGYTVTIEFEDKHGITRNMWTMDGSTLDLAAYVSNDDDDVFIYAGADLDLTYDADIWDAGNAAEEYGVATVMGTVYIDYDNGFTPNGNEELDSGLPAEFQGKSVIMSWDDAPHDIGLEMVYTFAIDADGNYVATVPTESISGWDVDAYFGMHDFIGTNLQMNFAATADTVRNAHYYLNNNGGLQDVLENDIEAGDIITGVNLTFTYTLLP